MEQESIPVVSTDELLGFRVKRVLGLVWGSSAKTKHLGHDLYAVIKGAVGGDIKAYEQMTNHAAHGAVHKMVQSAKRLGANAVVGVRFSNVQLLQATVDVFAYGTAVVVEKERK